MTYAITSEYAQADTVTQLYPALQADNYQPKLKDKISICFNEESFNLLSLEAQSSLELSIIEAEFKSGTTNLFQIGADVRLMPLAMPLAFCFNKVTSQYSTIQAGVKFKENNIISAAKVHFCIIVNGVILMDEDEQPQVVTLNLKSLKTQLVKSRTPKKADGSLWGWNEELKSQHNVRGWILHMFGFKLTAEPHKFVSAVSDDSSVGTIFKLSDPQVISPENQKLVFNRIQDTILKGNIINPYKLNRQQPATPEYSEAESIPYFDEIDF
jgi:hypothetical protein